MNASRNNFDFIYNFLLNELRFLPSCNPNAPFLPFSINKPFAVYDISNLCDAQGDLLFEIMPTILANCLPQGHQLYAIDWFHDFILYDPRNIKHIDSRGTATPQFNKDGIAYFHSFYPDGDYYFFIEKYGRFGYLAHPWRQEVWVYGEPLLSEVQKIHKEIGFIPKCVLK